MNVIIRLQNLPWSANATDIRNFFKGLMIPEGGVHIVGGENGDAFIAFSTDEDARQAMGLNGGKIKETQVSLLLSSRAEMQKVIEKARMATSTSFMSKIPAQLPQVLPAAVIANQFAKKLPEMAPQPPVISLTNFLTQSMQQQNQPNPVVAHNQMNLLSAYQALPPSEIPGLGAPPPQLGMGPQNAAVAAAAYANYYATLMDPNAISLNYVNQMSAAAGLKMNQQNDGLTQQLLMSKDPRGRRSNSREKNSNRRHRSRSLERKSSRRSRSNSRDRYTDSDKEGRDGSRRRTRFSAADEPSLLSQPPSMNKPAVGYNVPPPAAKLSPWEHPPPQIFNNFTNGNSSLPPTRHYQTESKSNVLAVSSSSTSTFGNVGTCVKVSNVDNETFYSDLRKFFAGLPIGNNDIKFVTDQKGNRNGVVLIRFLSMDSKKKALTKSMWQLKSTQVMITSVTEEEFESGVLNTNKGAANRQLNNDRERYERNDRERFRDRSDSREHDNRNYNRHGDGNNRNNNNNNSNNNNNRFNDRQQNNREHGGGGNFRRDQNDRNDFKNFKNFRNEPEPEKPKEYVPDENFTVLIIDDIPRTANEPDICEAFPNIISIAIDRYTAYVKFTTHDAAKVTLENRFIHYIRNKRVFLEAGSESQFNDLARKFGKFDNPELKNENEDDVEISNFNGEQVNDDTNHSNNSNSRDGSRNRDQRQFESRDPRQRNFNNNSGSVERFVGNGNGNGNLQQIKTDCVIIKNMESNTTIEEVEYFFKDLGIYKMRVHILLDKKGKPCGDCFVEFKYPNDSSRAISKNNQQLKNNRVQVMLIPREQVEAVLSSFGGDDSMRPQSQNRNQSRPDWAPPSDFGQPGCVLMLSNLCYKAAIEDIVEEFREFDLHPDQIIRRFNDLGQPTGNACINFNSPEDADMAIEKYNSVKIMNRPIWLKRT